MPKMLARCHSVKEVGQWLQRHGISPGENRHFGGVHPVHTASSWHYRDCSGNIRGDKQGELALDVNDNDVRDTWWWIKLRRKWRKRHPRSETETLIWLYKKIGRVARRKAWPLAEMFCNAGGEIRGYKAANGWGVNVSVPGHTTHLHVGFSRCRW